MWGNSGGSAAALPEGGCGGGQSLPDEIACDIDEAEAARLNKEIGAVSAEVKKISAKLNNPGFLAKAPEAVVTENRRRLDEEQTRMVALEAALNRLS